MSNFFKVVRVYEGGRRFGSIFSINGVPLQVYHKEDWVEAERGPLFCYRTPLQARDSVITSPVDYLERNFELWEVETHTSREVPTCLRLNTDVMEDDPSTILRFWKDPDRYSVERPGDVYLVTQDTEVLVTHIKYVNQLPWII